MEYVIDGHTIKMLFTFEINNKKYIAYLTEDDDVSASILLEDNDEMKLLSITDDEEWKLVEKEIEKRL